VSGREVAATSGQFLLSLGAVEFQNSLAHGGQIPIQAPAGFGRGGAKVVPDVDHRWGRIRLAPWHPTPPVYFGPFRRHCATINTFRRGIGIAIEAGRRARERPDGVAGRGIAPGVFQVFSHGTEA